MKNKIVVYHANCADGFGAAFAAWTKLGDEAAYIPMEHSHKTLDNLLAETGPITKETELYILDFSFDRDIMTYLFKVAGKFVWLDHHKTAFDMWMTTQRPRYVLFELHRTIILDESRSGALIAWSYFNKDQPVPVFINFIDDYDRWQFNLENTRPFNKGIWAAAPWTFEQWSAYAQYPRSLETLIGNGRSILAAHNQHVESVVKKSARNCCIILTSDNTDHVYPGMLANCPPHLTSDVGHELAVKSKTYGLCWTMSQTGHRAQCSLRSNDGYDVSTLAKHFGGGGHASAAGFEVPVEKLLSWMY